jgi:hypothetical protein
VPIGVCFWGGVGAVATPQRALPQKPKLESLNLGTY